MIAVFIAAPVITIALLAAAAWLIDRPAAGKHTARPERHHHGAQARAFLAELVAAHRKASGLAPEDAATVAWAQQLHGRREHGPAAPARRPQALAIARVQLAALIRALPLEAVPHLRPRQGYSDATGTFAAITSEADQ